MHEPEEREIVFFDANACLGRSVHRTPGAPYDTAGLIAELDHCQISRALVFHAAARELDSLAANHELVSICREQPRLSPCAVLSPNPRREGHSLVGEIQTYLEQGVRAFRMFPNYHGVSVSDPEVRAALDTLQERGLPLWLDFDQPWYNYSQLGQHEHRGPSLAAVESLAREFPGLPLLVCSVNYNHNSQLLALFGRCANMRIETSLFQGLEMLRRVVEEFGPERLLFGSGLPEVSAGAARAMLTYSRISRENKQLIAAGNLERLLGEGPTQSLPEQPERSPILLQLDRGEPISACSVHDCHGHIAPVGFEGLIGLTLGPQDENAIVAALDRTGIQALAVSNWEIYGGDAPAGNALAAAAADRHPRRIVPYMVVNPNYPEDWESQVEACFGRRRFFGLKPYPFSMRRSLTDPAFRPMLELAQKLQLPILCHLGLEPLSGVTPAQVEELAPRYHRAVFILAHAGASFRLAGQVAPLARQFANVYLEINYTSAPCRMLPFLARTAGTDKVLFGSDTPMRDPAPMLGWCAYDCRSDDERRAILGENLLALCRRIGYPWPGA
ncbi:amidohydrolase family protein [bacterium]|nr:amidohydrolase family protein [bacterium]